MAAFRLAAELRRAGVATLLAGGERSLKAQMRRRTPWALRTSRSWASERFATATVTLKNLADGDQQTTHRPIAARMLADRQRRHRMPG